MMQIAGNYKLANLEIRKCENEYSIKLVGVD